MSELSCFVFLTIPSPPSAHRSASEPSRADNYNHHAPVKCRGYYARPLGRCLGGAPSPTDKNRIVIFSVKQDEKYVLIARSSWGRDGDKCRDIGSSTFLQTRHGCANFYLIFPSTKTSITLLGFLFCFFRIHFFKLPRPVFRFRFIKTKN